MWRISFDRHWQELGKETTEMSNLYFFTTITAFCIKKKQSIMYHINFYCRCPKVITLNDVRNALANREEFDIFTNEGLGSRQELNTTEL